MTQIEATYIDHMGSDLSVVNAARVSFGKKSEYIYSGVDTNGPLERALHQRDVKLIQYLAKHNTPHHLVMPLHRSTLKHQCS